MLLFQFLPILFMETYFIICVKLQNIVEGTGNTKRVCVCDLFQR